MKTAVCSITLSSTFFQITSVHCCEDDLLLTNRDNLLSICCKVKCR